MNALYQERITARSNLKHTDKRKLVMMCIEKEKDGWECVSPIQLIHRRKRQFTRSGKRKRYQGATESMLYEAVYEKEFVR